MPEYIIKFVKREARKYREVAKLEKEPIMKKTDLKTAALFDLIGEMLADYLFKESKDRSAILERYGRADEEKLEKAG